jgi:hypothetical protein
MGRLLLVLLVPAGILVAASCGGAAFSTGGGADGGGDGTSGLADAASEAEGGGVDAPAETSTPSDAHGDAVEEPPPATCAGSFACVPAVPGGWSGPFELYAGASPAPACTADFSSAYDGNAGLGAPPAVCSCSCAAPNAECGVPSLSFYGEAAGACPSPACSTTNLVAGACKTVDDATGCPAVVTPAISAPAPVVVSANCTPQASQAIGPPTWATYAQACSSTTAVVEDDCQTGSVCAPKPAAPYGATLCISQSGDVACPPASGGAGYASKQLFYGSVDDQRTCTACTCGALGGASCSASFEAYSSTDGSCTGGGDLYVAPFSCEAVDQPADFRVTITAQNGSCGANPVNPTGSATATSPTTFCCLP